MDILDVNINSELYYPRLVEMSESHTLTTTETNVPWQDRDRGALYQWGRAWPEGTFSLRTWRNNDSINLYGKGFRPTTGLKFVHIQIVPILKHVVI
jgi:hypothetical protein